MVASPSTTTAPSRSGSAAASASRPSSPAWNSSRWIDGATSAGRTRRRSIFSIPRPTGAKTRSASLRPTPRPRACACTCSTIRVMAASPATGFATPRPVGARRASGSAVRPGSERRCGPTSPATVCRSTSASTRSCSRCGEGTILARSPRSRLGERLLEPEVRVGIVVEARDFAIASPQIEGARLEKRLVGVEPHGFEAHLARLGLEPAHDRSRHPESSHIGARPYALDLAAGLVHALQAAAADRPPVEPRHHKDAARRAHLFVRGGAVAGCIVAPLEAGGELAKVRGETRARVGAVRGLDRDLDARVYGVHQRRPYNASRGNIILNTRLRGET